MRSTLRRLVLALGIFALSAGGIAACGDDTSSRGMPTGGSGGSSGNGGSGGTGGTGGMPDAKPIDAPSARGDAGGTVSVTITAPTANTLIATATVNVRATITATGTALDTLSISATIGNSSPVHLTATGTMNEYGGNVPVSNLASGGYRITVTAATIDGGVGSGVVDVVVNAGPVITIARPAPNEPTNRSLTYDFQALISPALPSGINVGTVTAKIGLCSITLGTPSGPQNALEYTGQVDLTTCNPPLAEGPLQFVVTAADTSNPAVTATKSQVFVIDRTGPAISVVTPSAGQLVGGIISVAATINDPSGVQDSTVFATISHGGASFTFPMTSTGGGNYQSTFDTRTLPNPTIIQFPAVEVVADDSLGNHSTSGGITFALDNVPPTADLDPSNAVVVKGNCRDAANPCKCSQLFDPVGDNPNDGATVPQLFDLKAEVVDGANAGTGAEVVFAAGVDLVTLYVLDNTSLPLVVDSDGDGVCDTINPNVVPVTGMPPGANQAVEIAMGAIAGSGAANFVPTTYSGPVGGGLSCIQGDATSPPVPLCRASGPLTIALENTFGITPQPLIWSIPPIAGNQLQCDGLQFDTLANNIGNGWICVAVRAIDGLGNESVSPPLRLCVDQSGNGVCNAGTAPDCTGTLDRTTGQVSTTTHCTGRRFPNPQFVAYP